MIDAQYLSGQLLLAMPGIGDARFERSVIAMCLHDDHGALGLCLHHEDRDFTVPDLMRQLGIDPRNTPSRPVLQGGPVETGRGFVLHTPDWAGQDTRHIGERWALTSTLDVLAAIAEERGPQHWLVATGYAGWGAGQLERELRHHGWFTTGASDSLVFETDARIRWTGGFAAAGIDARMLADVAGHA